MHLSSELAIPTYIIDPVVSFSKIVDHTLIKIFSTKMGISRSCENFEHTIIKLEDGYIEGASTQVINKYLEC